MLWRNSDSDWGDSMLEIILVADKGNPTVDLDLCSNFEVELRNLGLVFVGVIK